MTENAVDATATGSGDLASGDARAFTRFVAAHEAAIYRLMLGQTGDAAEAHDLVQETFLRAFRHVERLAEVDRPRAWLSRVALNVARDWHRWRTVRRWIGLGGDWSDDAVLAVETGEPAAEQVLDARAALAAAWGQMARLPRSLRDPLLLCAVEGMSQAEAADILGISAKAVELRVRRGRSALAERLGRSGGGRSGT